MIAYNIVKVLANGGVIIPEAVIYGDVEIRPARKDLAQEKECIERSFKSMDRAPEEIISINARIACIVSADSDQNAIRLADAKFEEILDLISREKGFGLSRFTVSPCGYIKEMESGRMTHINDGTFRPYPAFERSLYSFQQINRTQYLLTREGELVERYKKSLHWSRNALQESNIQIKILFMWFALEALLKENETEMIAHYIRWFLGFPSGTGAQYVRQKIKLLEAHPRYVEWGKKIIDSLEKIRIFRNASVHSGFRRYDFSEKELALYEKILTLGSARCQNAVFTAISNYLKTVQEFKEYVGLIFDDCTEVNDIHGNVLFMLEDITTVS